MNLKKKIKWLSLFTKCWGYLKGTEIVVELFKLLFIYLLSNYLYNID